MKKNASVLAIAYLTFILLIVFSGSLTGILSEAVYFLGYILPFFAVIIFTDRELPRADEFSLTRESKRLFLPTVFPTVFVIVLLSLLTSFVISSFSGKSASADVGDSILFALFYHALLPSILEELLFRYLPMRYIAPFSRKYAVLFSAAFFALAHHSFFSMPYAFFAGGVFMTVNLLCDSSMPSMILHFVNNAISVVWSMYFADDVSGAILLVALLLPAFVSLAFAFRARRGYAVRLKEIFADKCELCITPSMIFAVITAIFAAVLELAV